MTRDYPGYDSQRGKERKATLEKVQKDENALLNPVDDKGNPSATWVDQDKGLIQIPIEEAMAHELVDLKNQPVGVGAEIPGSTPASAAAPAPAAAAPAAPAAPASTNAAPAKPAQPAAKKPAKPKNPAKPVKTTSTGTGTVLPAARSTNRFLISERSKQRLRRISRASSTMGRFRLIRLRETPC